MLKQWIGGTVVEGYRKARNLGYPTANIVFEHGRNIPDVGVYSGFLRIDGKVLESAVVCGVENRKIEVYVLKWDGDIYREPVELFLVEKVSDIVPFENTHQMKEKIEQDISKVRISLIRFSRRF